MAVAGAHAKAVVDHNEAPVAGTLICFDHHALARRVNGIAIMRRDVQPSMECAFAAEWVHPLAKMPGNFAHHRPKLRNDSETAELIGGKQARATGGHGNRRYGFLEVADFGYGGLLVGGVTGPPRAG